MSKRISSILLSLLCLTVFAAPAFSQTAIAEPETDMTTYYIILFAVVFILMNAIFIPLLKDSEVYGEGAVAIVGKKSALRGLYDKLTGLKPISQEKELLMDEDYDGIAELDNNVPPWFNILFYSTIVFAVIYLLNYHVLKIGRLPFQEYADEVYAADMKREELIRTGAFINENTVTLLTEKAALDNGKQVFVANCVPCHGNNAEGTVGPNLTDQFWIHGGGIKNVFKTIKYGVPAKGMIAWQTLFNPKAMQEVASYVLSLQGTNPPNGKPPEGNKYTESAVDSAKAGSDTVKTTSGGEVRQTDSKDTSVSKSGTQDTLKKGK